MQIKVFEAQDMRQAMTRIKQEFGPEAVILSSRTLHREDANPSKRPRVEVTAAMDYHIPPRYDTFQTGSTDAHSFRRQTFHLGHSNTCESKMFSSVRSSFSAQSHRNDSSLPYEERQQYPDVLVDLHRQILTQGVSEDIALELIATLRAAQPQHRLSEPRSLKRCLIRHLRHMGLKANILKLEDGKQSIVVFIGPTGVGKTTTIAKLAAAAHARKLRNSVGLITLDNHRIAAAEQLKIYGNIMGLPVQCASSTKDLRRAVKAFGDKHLILVDTAGLTMTNKDDLKDTGRVFARLRSAEIQLLLSATTKQAALMETVQIAEAIPLGRLLFTKLDQTSTHGSIFNVVYRTKIPISYFTNGQDIPEGIETATLGKLIDLIMTSKETDQGVWSVVPRILRRTKSRPDLGISHEQKYCRAAEH